MAKTSSGITSTPLATNFPGVIQLINEQAYKLQMESSILRQMCKPVGVGKKGGWIKWPYFDPTTFSTAASGLTETNDFGTSTQLTNASVVITSAEYGLRTDITDRTNRAAVVDIPAEAARQLGIGCALKLDLAILSELRTGITTGTVTGTNITTGFSLPHAAAAQSKLAAKSLTVPNVRFDLVLPEYAWFRTARGTYNTWDDDRPASVMGSVGEEILAKYHKKSIFGNIDVYTLPLNYIAASGTAAGFMFAHRETVGLWVDNDFSVEEQRDASARATEYVATFTAGAKTLVAGFGVKLTVNASTPTV